MLKKFLAQGALTLGGTLAGALLLTAPAMAASYPDKPITFVNPYSAGGPSDILVRIVAKEMSEILGQPIIVQSKPGAGASIGAAYVARSPADGYTALFGTAAAHIVTPMMEKVPYDGLQDFAFVGMVGNIPNVLTVHPTLGVTSVKELIEKSKAKPDTINYASAGNGSSPHLTGENFKLKTGASLLHIPYKGAAPATTDMVGGAVQTGFINLPAVLPFIKDNKLNALAIAAGKRSPALPNVPTFAELGYSGFEGSSWYSLAVPKETPKEAVDTLYGALSKALADPDVLAQLEQQGVEPFLMNGADAAAFIAKDKERIKPLLEASHIKIR